jgi:hypothetical protein
MILITDATTYRLSATLCGFNCRITGLLKKGLSAIHQQGGQNGADVSDATAAVADGRFRVGLRPGSKVGFFNSPITLQSLWW